MISTLTITEKPGSLSTSAGFVTDDVDALLIAQAKSGDVHAFERLMARHSTRLFNTILRIVSHREDAEDATQNALLRAYTRLQQFHGNSRFSSWLFRIGVNEALSHLRKKPKRFISLDSSLLIDCELIPLDLEETRLGPEREYGNEELANHLGKAIESLPDSLIEVFERRYIQDQSVEQVARELGITVIAVKSRLVRARRHLRKRLCVRRPTFARKVR